MATAMILLNVVLIVGVVLVIAGGLVWAIATQHQDHDVAATGSLFRRRVRSRPSRTAGKSYRRESQPAY